jgi:hypothetical protein
MERFNSILIAIEESLAFAENGSIRSLTSKNVLFQKLLPESLRTTHVDPLPKNIFRQCGSTWQLRFKGSEPVFLNRQKGAEYIAALLSTPFQSISVLDLCANGTMDEQTRNAMKAGGFKVVDYQHLVQFRERLGEMEKEIFEAIEYNDHERTERLRVEKENFLKQLKGVVGTGGKMQDPLKKPRDAVTKAISRTIKSIRKVGIDCFANHLEKHIITGNEIIYNPPDDVLWETAAIRG